MNPHAPNHSSLVINLSLGVAASGGAGDLNIGVGELQECTVSKSMDRASGKLAQGLTA